MTIRVPHNLRIENADDDGNATVYINGVIGGFWGDIDPQAFAEQIHRLDASVIHLRINSPGGDVFDARAMMTAIAQHPATAQAHVDGLAASAATDICMACDSVEITRGGRFMIHNAWTLALGDHRDMYAVGDLLKAVSDDILRDYANKTGVADEQIAAWMDDETWFTAEQAVEHGFADSLYEPSGSSGRAQAQARWNLAAYANAPDDLTQPPANDEQAQKIAAQRARNERRLRLLQSTAA